MYSLVIVRSNKIVRQEDGLTKRELNKLTRQYRSSGYQHFIEAVA